MKFKDYYETLGVARDATQDDIKRAYRRLARKYHPDVSKDPQAETRFKEVGEAYEVLKDPEKRAAYDQFGQHWKAGQEGFRPPPGWDEGFEFHGAPGGSGGEGFSDFFESLFGGGSPFSRSAAHGPGRGQDHHARISISLEQAVQGGQQTVKLSEPQLDSQGRVQLVERSLRVKIPPGIRDGQVIRLAGQGGQGAHGERGDLYLEVHLKPHPRYRVQGSDLFLDLPITPWEAALGAKVTVPTLTGKVSLKVPPGSSSGRKLRLKGRGIAGGDLYAVLQIVTPPADTSEAKALYEKMAEVMPLDPRRQWEAQS